MVVFRTQTRREKESGAATTRRVSFRSTALIPLLPLLWSTTVLRFCAAIAALATAFYFRTIYPIIQLPADILMWGETGFVGSIIKIRTGVSFYSSPADSNSIIYTPLPELTTNWLSLLFGVADSIPAWRWIQLGYVGLAALAGVRCWVLMRRLAYPEHRVRQPYTWFGLVFLSLFLAGTSERVNQFVHCLHGDALAVLVSVLTFWSMVAYLGSRTRVSYLAMTVWPAIGFLTKQFLVSWLAAMVVFVFLAHAFSFDGYQRRTPAWGDGLRAGVLFAVLAGGLVAATVGLCQWAWGKDFTFWVFDVMGQGGRKSLTLSPGAYGLSLPRGVDHALRAWAELAIGIGGGLWVLRSRNVARLGALYAACLVLLASQTVSSGAGWAVMYHFGPTVMIGCIWFLAALSKAWPTGEVRAEDEFPQVTALIRPLLAGAAVLVLFSALRVLPNGDRGSSRYWNAAPPSSDVYRYIADIEHEVRGVAPGQLLVDMGNWVNLRPRLVTKEWASALADQAPSNYYANLDVLRERIRARTYQKILMRDVETAFFLYDYGDWPRSSGVRQALRENYVEVRRIPAPEGELAAIRIHGPVSVFERRATREHTRYQ